MLLFPVLLFPVLLSPMLLLPLLLLPVLLLPLLLLPVLLLPLLLLPMFVFTVLLLLLQHMQLLFDLHSHLKNLQTINAVIKANTVYNQAKAIKTIVPP